MLHLRLELLVQPLPVEVLDPLTGTVFLEHFPELLALVRHFVVGDILLIETPPVLVSGGPAALSVGFVGEGHCGGVDLI